MFLNKISYICIYELRKKQIIMNEDLKAKMREIQCNLQRIENKEVFFFNITQYEKQGLIIIKNKYKTNNAGFKVKCGCRFFLTDKAKRFLNVII